MKFVELPAASNEKWGDVGSQGGHTVVDRSQGRDVNPSDTKRWRCDGVLEIARDHKELVIGTCDTQDEIDYILGQPHRRRKS